MARPISEFPGILLERPDVATLIDEGVRHAQTLRHREIHDQSLRSALDASIGSVKALLGAASVKCTIGGAPADIDVVADVNGNLVYQCRHNPTHKWDLSGHRI